MVPQADCNCRGMTDLLHSPLTHHFPAPAWCRPVENNTPDFHFGGEVNAGKDHQVRENAVLHTTIIDLAHSFMAHPETLLPMPTIEDPVQRFVSVIKFYLSGWHIKPPYAEECDHPNTNTDEKQWSQEAPQPYSRRDLYMLLGLSRQDQRLLHLRADLTPSSEIVILLHGARPSYPSRRYFEAAKQVSRQLRCKYDGRFIVLEIYKQRPE